MDEFLKWASREIDAASGIGFLIVVCAFVAGVAVFVLSLILWFSGEFAAGAMLFPGVPALIIWRAYQRSRGQDGPTDPDAHREWRERRKEL